MYMHVVEKVSIDYEVFLCMSLVTLSLWIWQLKFWFCEYHSEHLRQAVTVHFELLFGNWKRLVEETSTPVCQGQSKTSGALPSRGQYRSSLSNKKLELKTHSGGYNCIHPHYQLPDVMSDPVVITQATETIDPDIAVVSTEKALLLLMLLLWLLLLFPSEESFNERWGQ